MEFKAGQTAPVGLRVGGSLWEIGEKAHEGRVAPLRFDLAPNSLTEKWCAIFTLSMWQRSVTINNIKERCGFERWSTLSIYKFLRKSLNFESSVLLLVGSPGDLDGLVLEFNRKVFSAEFSDRRLARAYVDHLFDQSKEERPPRRPRVLLSGDAEARSAIEAAVRNAGYEPATGRVQDDTLVVISTGRDERQLAYALGLAASRQLPFVQVGDDGLPLTAVQHALVGELPCSIHRCERVDSLVACIQAAVLSPEAVRALADLTNVVQAALLNGDEPIPASPLRSQVALLGSVREATQLQQRAGTLALAGLRGTRRLVDEIVDHADEEYHPLLKALLDRVRAAGGTSEDFLRTFCSVKV